MMRWINYPLPHGDQAVSRVGQTAHLALKVGIEPTG